ncbi:DUF5655 domain-containing protein [Raineyella fluvialis]|uniref:DUF91 domain-containing protein n=1 Tax=Raineyella fluvialis TaxID=2662261 RepID=A0A5Q2FBM6_9ACTN|nr:DUF5655 domain-containing protein [Raineyella fluvialis]QGF22443.1 DUF91 domain-containing protein [Raineyella fluvialis]
MSDLKLFRISDGVAQELPGTAVALERSLQRVIERSMETIFGCRFLASEYSTGVRHGGRIDSLGLDENNSPVIFEYKRATNENVINQGLFYLDWLVDHRAEFQLLVMNRLGRDAAEAIDWRNPRLICVASGFTRYDEYAIQQMRRSIELVRYWDYGGELLAVEAVSATKVEAGRAEDAPSPANGTKSASATPSKTVTELLDQSPQGLKDLFFELDAYLEALGDDVTKKTLKLYFAYRRLKNFVCVEVHPQSQNLLLYLKVDPDTVVLEPGFSRDVRHIGHFGTGDLELRVTTSEELQRALPLVQQSYDAS